MELTRKQEEGLKIAVERFNAREPWTCISGYAGTGKSTLVQFIISALHLYPDQVAYIAYTGKAAMVLKQKGCPNAQTSHKLLYNSIPRIDGTYFHRPKANLDKNYKLIIVDEVSMLPKEIWDLLLSHHIPVIALGDPGQLPPIGDDNGVLKTPHIFLDEVMRQAQESEILRLSMDIREGKPLSLFKGNEVQVIDFKDVVDGMFTWADEVLVAKNATRKKYNQYMRQLIHGVTDTKPIEGDRVICLRNMWDDASEFGDVCVNGTIGTIHNLKLAPKNNKYVTNDFRVDFLSEEYSIDSEDKYWFKDVNMDYKLFTTGEPSINQYNFKKVPKPERPKEFDYGYCITCWKAQGSEYDKVLFFEETFPHEAEDHRRYLYTGITRAKEKLIIVRI